MRSNYLQLPGTRRMETEEPMNDEYFQISQAVECGRSAYCAGLKKSDNPYMITEFFNAWLEGWCFEEEKSFADACEAVAGSVSGALT